MGKRTLWVNNRGWSNRVLAPTSLRITTSYVFSSSIVEGNFSPTRWEGRWVISANSSIAAWIRPISVPYPPTEKSSHPFTSMLWVSQDSPANSILYFFISSSLPSVQSVDSVRRSGDTSRCGPVPPRQAPEYAWSSSPSGTGSGGDTGSRRAA